MEEKGKQEQENEKEVEYSEDQILLVFEKGEIVRAESPPGTNILSLVDVGADGPVKKCPCDPECYCICFEIGGKYKCWMVWPPSCWGRNCP